MNQASGTYNDNLWMSLCHLIIHILETLVEFGRNLLLVTDTEILQVERFWMSCICTHLCPFGGCRVAIRPFDEVEGILYPFVHLAHWCHILCLLRPHVPSTVGTLTADTAREDWYRLHAEVLAELEILKIA